MSRSIVLLLSVACAAPVTEPAQPGSQPQPRQQQQPQQQPPAQQSSQQQPSQQPRQSPMEPLCRQVCAKGLECQALEDDKLVAECVEDCLYDVAEDGAVCHQALGSFQGCIGSLSCAEFEAMVSGEANAKCQSERVELERQCDAKL
jgi:hypothetical protein